MEEIAKLVSGHNSIDRWKYLESSWPKYLDSVDGVLVKDGIEDDDIVKLKTVAIQSWLYGFEFINTISVVTPKTIVFFGNKEKIKLLANMKDAAKKAGKDLVFVTKSDKLEDREFDELFAAMARLRLKRLGVFGNEKQKGKMIEKFEDQSQNLGYEQVDVGQRVQEMLSVKDADALVAVKTCATVTAHFFGKFIAQIEDVVNDNVRISHQEISKQMDETLQKSKASLERDFKAKPSFYDFPYSPVVQSGGRYSLKPNAESGADNLSYDCILLNLGGKYLDLNCNIFRTLLINPTAEDKDHYTALADLHSRTIKALRADRSLKDVYEETAGYCREKYPKLVDKLPTTLGFGIGYEFKESSLSINNKNDRRVQKGHVLSVITSLSGLRGFGRDLSYSMHLADTIVVDDKGQPVNLTASVSTTFEDVGYDIDDEKSGKDTSAENLTTLTEGAKPAKTRAAKRNRQLSEEQLRVQRMREHQAELMDLKMKELEERVKSGNFNNLGERAHKVTLVKLNTYRPENFPEKLSPRTIHIDHKNYAVLLPIGKRLVPFHIACVKNVTKHLDGTQSVLRVNFHSPAMSSGNVVLPTLSNFGSMPIYIKELTYRSGKNEVLASLVKQMKDLQRKFRLQTSIASSNIKSKDKPALRNKLKSLSDIKMRPTMSGRKTIGQLSSYANGLRFSSKKGESLEIALDNVEHAIFKPCDDNMIIILHFYLIEPVIVNKKLTQHVQFFAEVGYTSEDLADPRKRHRGEFDEFEEERMEQQAKEQYNAMFLDFVSYTEQHWEKDLRFDTPYAELGFYGSYSQNNVLITPTNNTLAAIMESPFLIVPLEDIELVSIERVDNHIKNFDLIVIFKDYAKPVLSLSNVPRTNLDSLKEWLE